MKPFTYEELDSPKPVLDPRSMQQVRCSFVVTPDTLRVRSTGTQEPREYDVILAGVLNPQPADPQKPTRKEVGRWQYGLSLLQDRLCGLNDSDTFYRDLWLRIVVEQRPTGRDNEMTPCVGILYAKDDKGRWFNVNERMRLHGFARKKGAL